MKNDDYMVIPSKKDFAFRAKEEIDRETNLLFNGDIIYKTEHFPAVYKRFSDSYNYYWQLCNFQEVIEAIQEDIEELEDYLKYIKFLYKMEGNSNENR